VNDVSYSLIVIIKVGFLTFKSLPSFPANANSKVVFPEPGGPKSNVILQKVHHQNTNLKGAILVKSVHYYTTTTKKQ